MPDIRTKIISILREKHSHVDTDSAFFRKNLKIWISSPEYAERIADSIAKFWRDDGDLIRIKGARARNNRMSFSESQNHRCCYCGYIFTYSDIYGIRGKSHLRTASWEHVVSLADSSKKYKDTENSNNLVVACSLCNALRGRTTLDAYQFYDWVKDHLDVIQQIADGKIIANRKTMLPYFGKEFCRSGFK